MILLHPCLLVKVIFVISALCILGLSGEYFKKSVLIKKKNYDILGSRIFVEGTNIEYFSRIPYAKPPVGNLRFKHPQEIDGDQWEGVYNSTMQPNTCWQSEAIGFDKLNPAAQLWYSKTNMSEDCLYLTIWSPLINNKEKLPVMVWIYGGSFLSGSSTLEVYDGSILAAKNEVIVVSMQYRVGPLGFFYLDDKLVPGNQGLMDQRMVLIWVKNNIHNFNGDSDKITIFGESAGSVSISLHALSPLSNNLFNRAIMESATAMSSWGIETKHDAKEKSLMLSQYVDCNISASQIERLVKCLQHVDPNKLTLKQFDLKNFVSKRRSELLAKRGVMDLFTDASYFLDIFMRPIYDGYFVPKSIPLLMEDVVNNTNIEFLMGFNANEGIFFLLYGLDKWLEFFNKGNVQEAQRLSSSYPNYIRVSKFLLEKLATNDVAHANLLPLLLYEYNIPSSVLGWKRWNSTQVLSALDQLTGDQNFVCPVIEYAENLVENNKKVYLYSFQHRTEKMTFPKWVGTMHGYEIEYIFGMPFSEKFMNSFYSFTPEERSLSEHTMTMWANFAKYGNPTPTDMKYFDKSVAWPAYNTTDKLIFFFGTPQDRLLSTVRKSEKSRKCKFWTKVLPSITEMYRNQNNSPVNQVFWINILMMLQMIWVAAQII